MRKRIVWTAGLVLALTAGAAYGVYRVRRRPPDVTFKTEAAERRRIVGRITASGTVSALVTVQVGTQVSGRIQKLFVDYNSPVKKGELVAKLDPALFEASVRQAQANFMSAKAGIATAEANALNADRQYARIRDLREEKLAPEADLDNAEAAVAVTHAAIDAAKASLAQATAQLKQTQINLSYTNIVSPIDGVVISRSVNIGQTIAASLSTPTLFTIAQDLTKMQVDASIAEGDIGRLQVGMKTTFTVDSFPGERFVGKIREIRNAPATIQNVVSYDAVIDVDNPDLRLRPGMTANVAVIYAERKKSLAVPNTALRFRPPTALLTSAGPVEERHHGTEDGHPEGANSPDAAEAKTVAKTVWVMRDGAPQPIAIGAGLSDGRYTEVVDGDLQAGELLVLDSEKDESPTAPAGTAASMRKR